MLLARFELAIIHFYLEMNALPGCATEATDILKKSKYIISKNSLFYFVKYISVKIRF